MKDILELVGSFGGLVVMAGLFVWSYFKDKSKNDKMLERIDKSNENMANSVIAINKTVEVLKEYLITHDERAKKLEDDVGKLDERTKKIESDVAIIKENIK
jgi:peptidoglycan hydrolase CwlO-like protein